MTTGKGPESIDIFENIGDGMGYVRTGKLGVFVSGKGELIDERMTAIEAINPPPL